jgi:homoserine dehydrogenase
VIALVVALIGFAGTIGAALLKLISEARSLRTENSEQHAQGRALIEEHGKKLDVIQSDVKHVRKDVKRVTKRVDRLEQQ